MNLHRRPSTLIDADPPGLRAINLLADITARPALLPAAWQAILDMPDVSADLQQRATRAALRLLLERARPLAGPMSEGVRVAARELVRIYPADLPSETALARVHHLADCWLAGVDPAHDLDSLRDRLLSEARLIWAALSVRQQAICFAIWSADYPMDRKWIAEKAGLNDDSNLRDDLTELKKIGIITTIGKARATEWEKVFRPIGAPEVLDHRPEAPINRILRQIDG